jgi:hypothetical protein
MDAMAIPLVVKEDGRNVLMHQRNNLLGNLLL